MFVYGWVFSCLWNNSAAQAIFLKKYILYILIKSKRIIKVNSGKLVSLDSSGLQ